MSIRKIIFCDICNPQGMRPIEFRRAPRKNERGGRRISDGRSWIEGELDNAITNGWIISLDGRHICPSCQSRDE